MKDCWILSNAFFNVNWNDHVVFSFHFINAVYYTNFFFKYEYHLLVSYWSFNWGPGKWIFVHLYLTFHLNLLNYIHWTIYFNGLLSSLLRKTMSHLGLRSRYTYLTDDKQIKPLVSRPVIKKSLFFSSICNAISHTKISMNSEDYFWTLESGSVFCSEFCILASATIAYYLKCCILFLLLLYFPFLSV